MSAAGLITGGFFSLKRSEKVCALNVKCPVDA